MSAMSNEDFVKVFARFVFDILQDGDTTNERYYEIEKIYTERISEIDEGARGTIKIALQKANQLMWVNLTLQRAALSDEKRNETEQKKEALLNFFRTAQDI